MKTNKARGLAVSQKHNIPVANGLLEHAAKVQDAIWYFLYCIDKTTEEYLDDKTGQIIGVVLGAMPCSDSDVARQLNVSRFTARRWREHLTAINYIRTKRTPIGYQIEVVNSKKGLFQVTQTRKSDVPSVQQQSESDVAHAHISSPSDVQNHTSDVAKRHIRCADSHIQTEKTEREQKETEKPTPTAEAAVDCLSRLQRIQMQSLGWLSQTPSGGMPELDRLSKKYGAETIDLAFTQFIGEAKNTHLPNGDGREYLISYFVKSGQAKALAEKVQPWADAGFSKPKTVEYLESMDTSTEIAALTPEEIARIESLDVEHLYDRYGNFFEFNKSGTLKDFANELRSQAAATQ